MKSKRILSQQFGTPLGEMTIAATDTGICLLEFSSQVERVNRAKQDLEKCLNTELIKGENHHIEQAQFELAEYFDSKRQCFDVRLNPQGTAFQQVVWRVLLDIPYGETVSYLQQATLLNKASAVRAVANANGANKISIIIPCHRVIGSNGKLTGYGGGIERKRWLLDFERDS